MFIIQINKSDARVLASERLYAFAKNIYKIHVVWSNDWNGLDKMAQFHVGDTQFDVDMTNLDEVCIPWELFASECAAGKKLTVSFRGTWKEHIVIPTAQIDLGIIHESDIKSAEDYTPPAPPTPDLYQQLKDEIATKADDASFDPETRLFKLWADKQVIAEFEIPGGSTVVGPGDGDTVIVQGPKGDKGEDGFSPTITIEAIDGGHRVTVTDVNGEQSFDVMDGVDGIDGSDESTNSNFANHTLFFARFDHTPVVSNNTYFLSANNYVGKAPYPGDIGSALIGDGRQLFFCSVKVAALNGQNKSVEIEITSVTPLTADVYTKSEIDEKLSEIETKPGPAGEDGTDGESAYDIAVRNGFTGTEEEWLESLKGSPGEKGDPGNKGEKGEDGTDGESAYDIAVRNGFTGTEEEWIASLKGDKGDKGDPPDSINWDRVVNKPDLALKSDLANVYRYKGSVGSYDELPTEGLESGWVYNTEETGMNYAWNGEAWDALGQLLSIEPATQGDGVPLGVIVMWSGSAETIPSGWSLCDGQNGTPDLRGRFVLGESDDHTIGEIGGSEEVTLTIKQMPEHFHKYTDNVGTSRKYASGTLNLFDNSNPSKDGYNTNPTGGSEPHPNMPPYYVLAYIMKTSGSSGSSGGGSSGGTSDHSALINRSLAAQHPIGAISGLTAEIDRIPEPVEPINNLQLEEILK